MVSAPVHTALNGAFRFSLSSFSAYRLANFRLSPYDKSTSTHCRSSCFLYLSRESPVCTPINRPFRFSLSSSSAYRLANFRLSPYDKSTSTHCRSSCFLYLSRESPVCTPKKQALPLFIV